MEENLERRKFVLHRKEMKVSQSTAECMCVNARAPSETVRSQEVEIKNLVDLNYLASTVQGRLKRAAKRVGCDTLKIKFARMKGKN